MTSYLDSVFVSLLNPSPNPQSTHTSPVFGHLAFITYFDSLQTVNSTSDDLHLSSIFI